MELFKTKTKLKNEKKLSILNKIVDRNKLVNSGHSIDNKIAFLVAQNISINYRG